MSVLGRRALPHRCHVDDITIDEYGDTDKLYAWPLGTIVQCDGCGRTWEASKRPWAGYGQQRADNVMRRISRRATRKAMQA